MSVISGDDVGVEPPSVFLPPLKQLKTCPDNQIANAITLLRTIYLPEVRGSTRRLVQSDTRVNSRKRQLDTIRADPFERSFAIQWLTRFVSFFSGAGDGSGSQGEATESDNVLEEAASLLAICAGAAASGTVTRTFTFPLASNTSCTIMDNGSNPHSTDDSPAGDGHVKDELAIQDTDMGEIRVILRDVPLESSDFTSVGAQTWGGSCVLSEMIAESPQSFGIFPRVGIDQRQQTITAPFRALELGAGTGLASLVLGKVIGRLRRSFPQVDTIVATDFHPTVLANLRANVSANFPSQPLGTQASLEEDLTPTSQPSAYDPHVIVLPLDWSTIYNDATRQDRHKLTNNDADPQRPVAPVLTSYNTPPLDGPFDLIIGADIIYEHSHAQWVRSCVEQFLKRPVGTQPQVNTNPPKPTVVHGRSTRHDPLSRPTDKQATIGMFHLVVPLRRTHAAESRSVEEIFPLASDVLSSRQQCQEAAMPSCSGYVCNNLQESILPATELAIIKQDDILCDAYSDREEPEEVVYRYYRIGWV